MKLVRFTEKNVDGCGSDAEVILQIDSDEPVTLLYQKLAKGILEKEIFLTKPQR